MIEDSEYKERGGEQQLPRAQRRRSGGGSNLEHILSETSICEIILKYLQPMDQVSLAYVTDTTFELCTNFLAGVGKKIWSDYIILKMDPEANPPITPNDLANITVNPVYDINSPSASHKIKNQKLRERLNRVLHYINNYNIEQKLNSVIYFDKYTLKKEKNRIRKIWSKRRFTMPKIIIFGFIAVRSYLYETIFPSYFPTISNLILNNYILGSSLRLIPIYADSLTLLVSLDSIIGFYFGEFINSLGKNGTTAMLDEIKEFHMTKCYVENFLNVFHNKTSRTNFASLVPSLRNLYFPVHFGLENMSLDFLKNINTINKTSISAKYFNASDGYILALVKGYLLMMDAELIHCIAIPEMQLTDEDYKLGHLNACIPCCHSAICEYRTMKKLSRRRYTSESRLDLNIVEMVNPRNICNNLDEPHHIINPGEGVFNSFCFKNKNSNSKPEFQRIV